MKSRSIIRVRYAETDRMGFVYHSNFFLYFEIGRADYFREAGFTYRQLEEEQVYMPVTECSCRFLRPAFYDDELEVFTELEMISRLKLKFSYEVFRSGTRLAEGFTVHVPTTPGGKPCRIPARYLERISNQR